MKKLFLILGFSSIFQMQSSEKKLFDLAILALLQKSKVPKFRRLQESDLGIQSPIKKQKPKKSRRIPKKKFQKKRHLFACRDTHL